MGLDFASLELDFSFFDFLADFLDFWLVVVSLYLTVTWLTPLWRVTLWLGPVAAPNPRFGSFGFLDDLVGLAYCFFDALLLIAVFFCIRFLHYFEITDDSFINYSLAA